MRAVNRSSWPVWLGMLAVFSVVIVWQQSPELRLADRQFAIGYLLFASVVVLALYNSLKRLSILPIGTVSMWLTLHIAGGALAVVFFVVHVGSLWPIGPIHRALAALFYAVCLSGVLGYGLQLWLPGRLGHAGPEIIYERIPALLSGIRAQVESTILEATSESGNETLGREYLEALAWYFAKPRFFWNNVLGGRRAQHWMRWHLDSVGRYLTPAEQQHLARIAELASEKRGIDLQYALQSLLKRWTIFHVPLAAAMLTLAVWHLILVHVFAR